MSKNESVNIIMLFKNFYKYKWSVIVIFLVILLITFLYIKKTTPIFSSDILISVESDQTSNISLFQNKNIVNIDMESKLEYDTKILKSRHVISKVLEKIDFSTRFFLHNKWRNEELYQKEIPFKVKFINKSNKSSCTLHLKTLDKNGFILNNFEEDNDSEEYYVYGQAINTKTFKVSITKNFNVPSNIEYQIHFDQNQNRLISNIIRKITIEKQANRLLKIHYEDSIPLRAKDVVSQLIKSYKNYILDSRQRENINHIAFLNQAISDAGKSLNTISDKIKIYRTKNSELLSENAENKIFSNIINKDSKISNLSLKLNALKQTENRIKKGIYSISMLENNAIESKGIKELLDQLKKRKRKFSLLRKQEQNLESLIIQDTFYANLLTHLKNDQMELKRLLLEYTEEYSQVKKTRNRINSVQLEIENYIENHINSCSSEIRVLKNEINKTLSMLITTVQKQYSSTKESQKKDKTNINSIPRSTIKLEELERAFNLNEKNYKKLLQKRSEALISKESTISNIQIVDTAMEPIHPIKPKKSFLYLSGLIIALFLSMIYTSFRILKNKTIYDENDILLDNYSLIQDKNKNIKEILWVLISKLEEQPKLKKSKIILISSSSYKENKLAILKQLSFALDKIFRKVLIIDFDFKNSTISQTINMDSNLGLSNILTSKHNLSEIKLSDYIVPFHNNYQNIDLLSSGPIIPNSSTLLFNPKVKSILEELSKFYDYILINSTPIGMNPTINLLFEHSDVLLLVSEVQKTDKKEIQKLNEFKKHNMETIVFLTDTKQRKQND